MKSEPGLSSQSASKSKNKMKKIVIEQLISEEENTINENEFNFDANVNCMNESVVVEYLHDILSFLLSDRTEVSFEASGHEQFFLVNILKSRKNLKCQYFNRRCASMSQQIIKVLDKNIHVYICSIHTKKEGDRNSVIFRKEPLDDGDTPCCEEDTCCASNPQSITESLLSDCPHHNSHKVSREFKERWLNTTLRFIKDESKHKMNYPEMSPIEATFVYSMITRCKEPTDNTSPNVYYTPLKEAMTIFGLKYFFELTYLDTVCDSETMSLVLEKIPKNIKSIIEGDKKGSNRFRNLKYIKKPKSCTSDENRAGRVLSRLKNLERLKTDTNRLGNVMPTEDDERQLIQDPNASCTPNMDRLNILAPKNSCKNKAGKGGNASGAETDGAGGSRMSRRDRSAHKRTNKLIKDMSVPIKSDKAMKMMYGMGWDGGALGARGDGITEPIIPSLDLQAGAGLGHASRSRSPKKESKKVLKAKSRRPPPMRGIADLPPLESPEPNQFSMESKPIIPPPMESNPLISTPIENNPPNIESESPIPPSIESKVACFKIPTPLDVPINKQRINTRPDTLQMFLDMITSSDTTREVKPAKGLTSKERRFITHIMRCANERTENIGLADQHELKLWHGIAQAMTSNPDLHIKAAVSKDSKIITLTKDATPYISKKAKRKLNKRKCIVNIPKLPEGNKKFITNDFLRELTDSYIAAHIGSYVSTKATTGITFRIAILIHLLEVVYSDRMQTEIEFEKVLNDKEKDYLYNTVATLGARNKRGGSRLEQEIFIEMKDNLDGYVLRVEFLNDRTFYVNKVDKKCLDKSSRDISSATWSTDDYDKNYLTSRSDDTDVGQDDHLDNDDNDGDDERYDSNDASEASRGLDIHDNASAFYKSIVSKIVNLDTTKGNASNKPDVKQETTDSRVQEQEMDAQDSVKGITNNLLQMDSRNEVECDIFKVNTQDLEEIIQIDDLKTCVLDSKVHKIDLDTEFHDSKNKTVMNDAENNNNNSKSDVIKSCVEYIHENFSTCDIKQNLKNIDNGIEHTQLLGTVTENLGKEIEKLIPINNIEECDLEEKGDIKICDTKHAATPISDILQSSATKEKKEQQKNNTNKYIKRVYLVPNEYPIEEVNTEFAKNIQIVITNQIEIDSTELPLLKCHGVQDGALVYSCYSENTLKWLENVCVANKIKIIIPVNDEVRYKMSLKINSFIDYTSAKLFRMLQLYNQGLQTEYWVELSLAKSSGSLTFIVEIDQMSMKHIKESNFMLFAGIDQVQFTPVWN